MSDQNPNQAPPSSLEISKQTIDVTGPRTVQASRGFGWFGDGFVLFKRSPWIWILNTIIFFVIFILLGMIPIVSLLSSLLSPVIVAGLMLGCQALDKGEQLEVSHVFAGFQKNTAKLVGLGAINLLLWLILVAIAVGIIMWMGGMDMTSLDAASFETGEMNPEEMMDSLLGVLIVMLLVIPMAMLFWFAPTLIVLHDDMGIFQSMKLSFMGCAMNILPFTLYGILGMVLTIVASLPMGLGWLILMPVLFGSIYVAYKDIYLLKSDAWPV